jgi:hypothetical protein
MEKRKQSENRLQSLYAAGAVLFLAVSTVFWALAGARLQQGNADQLADGFLFQGADTFSHAQFPASHTQLLKWPLFWLLAGLHNGRTAYLVITVLISLLSVGLLAYVLYRINRRPLVFGTLCLALACTLALIPAQVLGGLTAPLNMALATGRNVEYPLYVLCLTLFIGAKSYKQWQWSAGIALMGLLIASDHLFLLLSLASSGVLLLAAYGWQKKQLLAVAWLWFTGSTLGWLVSVILVWYVRHFTFISGAASPYGHVHSLSSLSQATGYSLKAVLLNFGITTSAGGLTTIAAIINVVTLAVIIFAVYKVTARAIARQKLSTAQLLSLTLIVSSAVAIVMYICTDHPYAADARYLGVTLFAGFIALATYTRTITLNAKTHYVAGVALIIATSMGVVGVWQHTNQTIAKSLLTTRNMRVVVALQAHPEQILVGNYWRVLPIKEQTNGASQQIIPLIGCVQPKQTLTSTTWNSSLYTHSFAYLLPVQPDGTPFGRCNIRTVEFVYGKPSQIIVIAGSAKNPMELLLLYNDGAAARVHGSTVLPPSPVFGAPAAGNARPTGSMITPFVAPS